MRSVLEHLVEEEGITDDFVHKFFSWKPSGFSVDSKVRITAGDAQGRKQLARYMIRTPLRWRRWSTRRSSAWV